VAYTCTRKNPPNILFISVLHVRLYRCTCTRLGLLLLSTVTVNDKGTAAVTTLSAVCVVWQEDPEDLSFKKGDKMTVLRKDEDEWWFARHEDGRTGSIPVPYLQIVSMSVYV